MAQLLSLSPSPSPGCSLAALSREGLRPIPSGAPRWWQWMWSLAVGQRQPRRARARSLAAAPLPGLPSRLSSLVTSPALIQGTGILQIWAVLERKWTPSGHSGRSLSSREQRGRGAPALAGTRCQLFPAPSGSSQHLQGLLAVESSAWGHSLPCWGCWALPGGLTAGGELCPGIASCSRLWEWMGLSPARVSPSLPNPHILRSPAWVEASGWIPRFPVPGGRGCSSPAPAPGSLNVSP